MAEHEDKKVYLEQLTAIRSKRDQLPKTSLIRLALTDDLLEITCGVGPLQGRPHETRSADELREKFGVRADIGAHDRADRRLWRKQGIETRTSIGRR